MICPPGGLSGAKIWKQPGEDGWQHQFITKKPVDLTLVIETERGSVRTFKKINAAIRVAENVGVAEVNVIKKN